jgi:hypothetical protein
VLKTACVVVCTIACLLTAAVSHALLAKMTEQELSNRSVAIVFAEFIGASELQVKSKKLRLNVGVLRVRQVLKGTASTELIFIRQYPRTDIVSDTYNFEIGKRGLWFLQESSSVNGLYQVSHPARFIEMDESSAVLERWKTLLGGSATPQ